MPIITNEKRYYRNEALMRYARLLGFGEIHTKVDTETGLHAIIAIHSTKLGPAIGGCRCYRYNAAGAALKDALRLAYMMTLKAAISDLPHGGAKSVILRPETIHDREAFFRSFGDFVHQMNGDYITAIDVGSSQQDMNTIAERTPYVIGTSHENTKDSDPSPHTARGVFRGIQAAVKFKMDKDNLDGVHVAIQGAGRVGYDLGKFLVEQGATLTVCDPNPDAVQAAVDNLGAKTVDIHDIYDVDCDIFAPCAMGGTINKDYMKRCKATIIAGSANNQLAHRKYGRILHERDILYAPDFMVNAGGLINAAMVYDFQDAELADQQIDKLYGNTLNLFERAAKENLSTTLVAEEIAREKIESKKSVTEPDQTVG